MTELETIKRQLDELLAWKASLEQPNQIPLDIDNSFRDRMRIDSKLEAEALGTVSTESIALSGNAESITVPANPSGTLKVRYQGVVYELLYK